MIDQLLKGLTRDTFEHISKNYSQTEIGLRHPKGPLGIITRDQGQLDLYAGKSRMIFNMNGNAVGLFSKFALWSDNISLQPSNITNLKILGKNINPGIFNIHFVPRYRLAVGQDSTYFVIGPSTIWDNDTQRFINPIPLSQIFEPVQLFQSQDQLNSAKLDAFVKAKKFIGL